MTAKEVIDYMSGLGPNEELIIGWWERSFINEQWSNQITESEWSDIVAHSESMNWSDISERIDDIVDSVHIPIDEDEDEEYV